MANYKGTVSSDKYINSKAPTKMNHDQNVVMRNPVFGRQPVNVMTGKGK